MTVEHVIQTPNSPVEICGGRLTLHQIPSARDNLIWLVVCNETGDCAAIDGPEAHSVNGYCVQNGFRLTKILNTHTHPDHIGINVELQREGLLEGVRVFGSATRADQIPGLTDPLMDGDELQIGHVTGRAWLTEGHQDGHISYIFGDVLFCGDTLFAGGCGYIFDGPPQKLYDSLMRFTTLKPNTLICCGHDYTLDNLQFALSVEPNNAETKKRMENVLRLRNLGRSAVPSTLELELKTNPFLRGDSVEIREHVMGKAHEDVSGLTVFTKTRQLKDKKLYKS